MNSAGAVLPAVMRTSDVEMHEYPDHANVLAVVRAYTAELGPMPYALLLEVMEMLEAVNDQTAIQAEGGTSLAQAVHNVVTDLRRLNLVELSSSGTVLTPGGLTKIATWNGKFRERSEHATQMLREFGFLSD
jgi:hypothetical protein